MIDGKTLARFAALGMAFALAGCVTAENSLSQNDVANMKLTAVNVSFTANSLVTTPDGEKAYTTAKGIPEGELSVLRTPEYKQYVRNMVAPKIRGGVEQAMAGRLNGSRPVRLEIVVERYDLPSVMSRVLLGGTAAYPTIIAAVTLVDAGTGSVILANPEMESFLPTPGGIIGTAVTAAIDSAGKQGQEDKLVASFGRDYGNWLTHGA